jgi:hypothetical protein
LPAVSIITELLWDLRTTVIIKRAAFWVVTPCSSESARRFVKHFAFIFRIKEYDKKETSVAESTLSVLCLFRLIFEP